MKTYIKPNTEVYAVELQKMIADSFQKLTEDVDDPRSKETYIEIPSSTSVWDEEE